jgi:hypothetical protein
MARMIPPFVAKGTPSLGEAQIFQRIRDDPGTRIWTVLHSLNLSKHPAQLEGEADFVLLMPGLGVLCLEVKGASRVARKEGIWYFGNDAKGETRGPFRQAAAACHSLRAEVCKKRPELRKVPFWSAVAFPFVHFAERSVEWEHWQVIDRRTLTARPISQVLTQVLKSARHKLTQSPSAKWFHPDDHHPTEVECQRILEVLRPNFEVFEDQRGIRAEGDSELKQFTEEQYLALDAIADNPRVVFIGSAGTGKTVLALEAARRAAAMGSRVLLLCFNRLLGRSLSRTAATLGVAQSSTLHRYLLRLAGISASGLSDPNPGFWKTELPMMALEGILTAQSEENLYDTLIIDEAQDLLRQEYLDILDLSLRGGLAAGNFLFFGDFERQDVYGAKGGVELLKSIPISRYRLSVNCRNTPRVAAYAHLLGGLEPNYKRVLRSDDGQKPRLKFYSGPDEQVALLIDSLEELVDEGFSGQEIVILSSTADQPVAGGVPEGPWRNRITGIEAARRGDIGHTTIHSFKGLETPAVILTDLTSISGTLPQDLFYIGVTRALHRLHILASQAVRTEMLEILT